MTDAQPMTPERLAGALRGLIHARDTAPFQRPWDPVLMGALFQEDHPARAYVRGGDHPVVRAFLEDQVRAFLEDDPVRVVKARRFGLLMAVSFFLEAAQSRAVPFTSYQQGRIGSWLAGLSHEPVPQRGSDGWPHLWGAPLTFDTPEAEDAMLCQIRGAIRSIWDQQAVPLRSYRPSSPYLPSASEVLALLTPWDPEDVEHQDPSRSAPRPPASTGLPPGRHHELFGREGHTGTPLAERMGAVPASVPVSSALRVRDGASRHLFGEHPHPALGVLARCMVRFWLRPGGGAEG